ncbi:MAG: NAD(P)/FAD-dependent oxidoreductase [Candidatus Sericytochromatia bacterium]
MGHADGPCAEVAILGGGLAGWSLARALLEQGLPPHQLILLEARVPGAGASGVPWALLHPFPGRSLYPRPGYLAAWEYSLAWLEQLSAGGEQGLVRHLPLWRLAHEDETALRFERSWQRAQALTGYPLQRLDPQLWPGAKGLYELGQGRLVALPALLQRLRQLPISSRQSCGKVQLEPGPDAWTLSCQPGDVRARQVVLACGSQLADYLPSLDLACSYGEVASFRPDPDPELQTAISAAGHFVAPLGQGLYHGGATHYAATCSQPPLSAWRSLQQSLDWLPGIAKARLVSLWSGIRCGLRHDREPVVGSVVGHVPGLHHDNGPAAPGLWVMGAFSTRGLLLIPTAATALAREILGTEAAIPVWMGTGRIKI